jgi:hypothetical protein
MFGHKAIFMLCIFKLFTWDARVSAQAQSTIMPEVIGVPYYIDPVQNTAVPLEKELANTKFSSRMLGFAGSTTRAELKGNRSSFRLRSAQVPEFVIRGVDPSRFKLYRLKSKKDRRELRISSSGVLGLSGKVTLEEFEIPLSIAECGLACYKLKPESELGAGEYAISPVDSNDSFTFGIDPRQMESVTAVPGSNP